VQIFEDLLALLHPFMPFITEEVYHAISPREEGDDIILKAYPAYVSCDEQMIKQGDLCAEIITKIRELKARNQLKPRDAASLQIAANASKYELIKNTILKMSYLDNITFVDDVNQGGLQFVVDNIKMNLIVEASIDTADQTEKLIEELHYIKGFRDSVLKKLSNEKFVNSAPEAVVAIERKKLNDAEERIVLLENSLK
jgi:valyl-tRNA synthetase